MKNEIKVPGYANNVKVLSNNVVAFNIAYSIKKNDEYKNVWISARTKKGLEVEENARYEYKGFIAGDSWVSKENKERNKPVLVITELRKLEKGDKSDNKYSFGGTAVNVKTLENGNIVGAIAYKIKNLDNEEKNVYFDFIAKKGVILEKAKTYNISGFLTGDVWVNKEGQNRNKTKLFIMEATEVVPESK